MVKRYWQVVVIVAALLCLSSWAWASSNDARNWHDPMRPQLAHAITAPTSAVQDKLHLEATLIATQRSSAVIGGTTVVVGDTLHGYRVKAISKNGVILSGSNGQIKLSLQSDRAVQLHVHASNNNTE